MNYSDYLFKVPKEKKIRLITDTDAKNEGDDQFAIVQSILSPKCDHVGFIAAHFGDDRCDDSMERSYKELERIFEKMAMDPEGLIYRGAERALTDTRTPQISQGAKLIVEEAMKEDDRPLFITFMGPLTDMASALLMEPAIAKRVTVIWIGGGPYPEGSPEFNLGNDIHGANVVFSSQVEVWQVPKNVYEMMPVSFAELSYRVAPHGAIGRYLFDQLIEHSYEDGPRKSGFRTGETWVLGDNPSIGLILYEHRFEFDWVAAPYITGEMRYVHTGLNRPIRVYRNIDSRLILEDMYAKIALFAEHTLDI